ncbi:hypothetical protein Tco_0927086 [Tanacetum coccineum]|uniref:C-type lectin domain-containing protein n=1 Tax=Tanacetum coccineum TaxID=301880 RepID=A0ABQ5DCR9_9ASTR
MISPGSSGYSSNDMVYKHYLEEAKKKTQESSRNSEPSVMPSARSPPKAQLWWKPTGKIFKTVGLKWIPTGKIFTSSTTKVDSEPTNGSNDDITNQYECKQTLDVSAGTLNIHACTSLNPIKEGHRELRIHDHSNELSSSKLVPKVVPPADKTDTSRQELELLFHHHITILRTIVVCMSWINFPPIHAACLEKGSLSNCAGCNCSSTPSEMTRDCVSFIVDEVLAAGASCSMKVDNGVPVGSQVLEQ